MLTMFSIFRSVKVAVPQKCMEFQVCHTVMNTFFFKKNYPSVIGLNISGPHNLKGYGSIRCGFVGVDITLCHCEGGL